MEAFDLVVIGGGAGGLVTASGAARLGAKVALIERERFGGECLWTGCVPSKALIRSAKIKHLMEHAGSYGFRDQPVSVEFDRVMRHMRDVIMTIQPHDDPDRFRKMGVEVIQGRAAFSGPDRLEVNGRVLKSRRFCIAVGAGPLIPPVDGLDRVPYMTHLNFFDQSRKPEHLIVMGGGPVGCEMGQTFHRLGSRVTIIEALDRILHKDDRETTNRLHEILVKEGLRIELNAKAEKVEREGERIRLRCGREGQSFSVEGDALLIAAGKRPRVEGLGLAEAGVEFDHGGIKVDRCMRTTNPRVFACGDVTGGFPFTHMAEYQAGLVVANALVPFLRRKADYSVVPWCTFTDPELAQVGLTEEQAQRRFGEGGYRVWRFAVADNDRHIIDGEKQGTVKLLTRPNGRIIGCTILSANAGDLIHEYALALRKKGTVADISGMIHVYPTRAQANKRASDQYFAEKFFGGRIPKVLSWWLRRVRPKTT
ncbi:MAG TPA: FAD-dependent oxidoreductase [Nitrospiria bacterium]|nr:FAD-dependent oxidoreductase [Nitrospiria bacterium]